MGKIVDPQTGEIKDDGVDPAAAYLANPTPANRAAVEAAQAKANPSAPAPSPAVIKGIGASPGQDSTVFFGAPGGLVSQQSLRAGDTPVRPPPAQQSVVPAALPQPAMIRQVTSGGSSKTTPAQYNKAEVLAATTALKEREKAAGSIKALQLRGVEAMRETIARQILDRKQEADDGDDDARDSKERLDKLNLKLDGYSKAIENAKVDPQRLLSQMTTTQRVMLTIGQMLGGYVEGATMGKVKNAATAMLNKAVDQDIAAQRANIAKITAQAGMTSKQAAQVMVQWQASARDKKDAMLALAGLQLTAAGLESKEADIAAKYHDVALGLKLQQVDVSSKGRDKTTKTSSYSSRMVPNPLAKANAKAGDYGKEANTRINYAQTGSDALLSLIEDEKSMGLVSKTYGSVANRLGLGSESGTTIANRDHQIALVVKSLSGVTAREDEVRKQVPRFPSPGDSPSVKWYKVKRLQEERIRVLTADASTAARMGKDPAPIFSAIRSIQATTAKMAQHLGQSAATNTQAFGRKQ